LALDVVAPDPELTSDYFYPGILTTNPNSSLDHRKQLGHAEHE
jgi:hypothetical protein